MLMLRGFFAARGDRSTVQGPEHGIPAARVGVCGDGRGIPRGTEAQLLDISARTAVRLRAACGDRRGHRRRIRSPGSVADPAVRGTGARAARRRVLADGAARRGLRAHRARVRAAEDRSAAGAAGAPAGAGRAPGARADGTRARAAACAAGRGGARPAPRVWGARRIRRRAWETTASLIGERSMMLKKLGLGALLLA